VSEEIDEGATAVREAVRAAVMARRTKLPSERTNTNPVATKLASQWKAFSTKWKKGMPRNSNLRIHLDP
jgi:hypothetical protein